MAIKGMDAIFIFLLSAIEIETIEQTREGTAKMGEIASVRATPIPASLKSSSVSAIALNIIQSITKPAIISKHIKLNISNTMDAMFWVLGFIFYLLM